MKTDRSLIEFPDMLAKLKSYLLLNEQDLSKLMDISMDDIHGIFSRSKAVTPRALFLLARELNVNEENLLLGEIDFSSLVQHRAGNLQALPERYLIPSEQLSRARGIQVIFEYLSKLHGKTYAKSIFERLQIHSATFENLDGYVSSRIGQDLLNQLINDGFDENHIRSIGTMTLLVNADNIGRILRTKKTPKDLYGTIHEEVISPYYDRAFSYGLETLTDHMCLISATPKEEALSAFDGKPAGGRAVCLYKQGTYISFLANIRSRFARVQELGCVYHGDAKCLYSLTWT